MEFSSYLQAKKPERTWVLALANQITESRETWTSERVACTARQIRSTFAVQCKPNMRANCMNQIARPIKSTFRREIQTNGCKGIGPALAPRPETITLILVGARVLGHSHCAKSRTRAFRVFTLKRLGRPRELKEARAEHIASNGDTEAKGGQG